MRIGVTLAFVLISLVNLVCDVIVKLLTADFFFL